MLYSKTGKNLQRNVKVQSFGKIIFIQYCKDKWNQNIILILVYTQLPHRTIEKAKKTQSDAAIWRALLRLELLQGLELQLYVVTDAELYCYGFTGCIFWSKLRFEAYLQQYMCHRISLIPGLLMQPTLVCFILNFDNSWLTLWSKVVIRWCPLRCLVQSTHCVMHITAVLPCLVEITQGNF